MQSLRDRWGPWAGRCAIIALLGLSVGFFWGVAVERWRAARDPLRVAEALIAQRSAILPGRYQLVECDRHLFRLDTATGITMRVSEDYVPTAPY